MSPRVVDLDLRRALRREVERIAAEHPDLTGETARERCAAWLASKATDGSDARPEHVGHAQRRKQRRTSRTDR